MPHFAQVLLNLAAPMGAIHDSFILVTILLITDHQVQSESYLFTLCS